ncbi:hypothetical protein [Sporosarcina sp. FSL W7-1283]
MELHVKETTKGIMVLIRDGGYFPDVELFGYAYCTRAAHEYGGLAND